MDKLTGYFSMLLILNMLFLLTGAVFLISFFLSVPL